MPKLKTHKGARKRFKVTAKKKISRHKACKSHLLTKKSSRRKRNLGKKALVRKSDRDVIKKMLPYDF